MLLNKSLLISVCFVVICIFPTTEIWPRNKNAIYLIEMLLSEASGGMRTMSEDQVAACAGFCPASILAAWDTVPTKDKDLALEDSCLSSATARGVTALL